MTDRTTYLSSLVGRRYQLGARGPDAFDCYGLVRKVMADLGSIEMPADLGVPYASTRQQAEAMLSHAERAYWTEIDPASLQDLDLVLMGNIIGRDFHLGVYIVHGANTGVLHVDGSHGVVIDDLVSLRVKGYNYCRPFRRA